MKKFIQILFLIVLLTLNTVTFAKTNTEVPKNILVQLQDGTVEEMDLDTYLYGVVKKELYNAIGEKTPIEALKAQAVASRSYAVTKILSAGDNAKYHVTSTTKDQVYEKGNVPQKVIDAVDETSGQVITYDDEIVTGYFFSTSGGHTESSENVWSAALPYVRGVEDPYEPEVKGNTDWTVTYTQAELKKIFNTLGEIEDIEITELSENDRVIELVVTGSKGEKVLTKNGIRTPFGTLKLKSQWFDVEFEDGEATFTGHGNGHGVGMSQYGAVGMANEGFTYDEILKWYYTDIEILGFDDEDYIYIFDDDEDDDYEDYEEEELETPLLDSFEKLCTTNWMIQMIKR